MSDRFVRFLFLARWASAIVALLYHCASCNSSTTTPCMPAFTYFCHFPVMMLVAAAGAALLDQPLMRQPTATPYAEFALLAGACLAVTVIVARTVAGTRNTVPARL